jgi:hypothetical protein
LIFTGLDVKNPQSLRQTNEKTLAPEARERKKEE